METLSTMIAEALRVSLGNAVQQVQVGIQNQDGDNAAPTPKIPSFSMSEYRPSEGTSVTDYFNRFKWALQLSLIPERQYANYARVHMGAELNNALKFLVSPRDPAEATFEELQTTLINHFDRTKNKYVESIKFRQIVQQKGEPVAQFVLRLKQAAAYCEYGDFLDRMLIEQLLHGLEERDTCDEIIAKKPATFKEAFEIAHSLEATRSSTREINTGVTTPMIPEETNKLGYESLRTRKGPTTKQPRIPSSGSGGNQHNREAGPCNGCGGRHWRSECRFRDVKCHNCDRKGHIAKVCRSMKSNEQRSSADQVASQELPLSEIDAVQMLNQVYDKPADRKMINVKIDGYDLKMELDTGAPCGIIAAEKLRTIKPRFSLQKTDRQFKSYSGHHINCLGRIPVNVSVGSTVRRLNLYVVSGVSDSLFGREWISHFAEQINLNQIFAPEASVNSLTSVELTADQNIQLSNTLNLFEDIFSDMPGKLVGPPAKVQLKPGVSPVFARAHDVPFALRERYAAEISKKIASGVYERVDYSEWASPTHVVVKKNGNLRITGNYKATINPRMIVDEHPIPKIDAIFNKMKGASMFCHLDVTDAYTHLSIDGNFSHVLTLNTSTHGLIRPTRAVYGAANIPAIWQRRMETLLNGLENVVSFYDDIILFAKDFDELLQVIIATLGRLRLHGLRLNRTKCVFATPQLECLGHKIDRHGLHKSDSHIAAVRNAPRPSNKEELQLFLGKATYYSSFIPNLSSRARCLRDMLLADTFKWTPEANQAYHDVKEVLLSPQVLMQYDPTLPLILATDASKTGLGAVLSHQLSDGRERPIAFASTTMSSTQQRYPQIDKEALAIVWAVKKFFYYLYARKFTLITDHKPLTQILHPSKTLPALCISRMSNYADYLAHFNFNIVYKPTKQHTNADYCSRIPNRGSPSTINSLTSKEGRNERDDFEDFALHQIQQLPVRAENIACETRKDVSLGKIMQLLEAGRDLARAGYKSPESKYTLTANCLLFEHRVVIPTVFRQAILNDLHVAHLGVVKMKSLARSFVYWPGIDSDIEQAVRSCKDCARQGPTPPKFNSHHWEYPNGPWERIHIDYAGPVADTMLLIIVDAYSKWVEVKHTTSTTAAATINILDELFSAYGVPTTVVSDNGPQFSAVEFKDFLRVSGVKFHKLSAPYHPATNGQAERYVQTVKQALKAMNTTKTTLKLNINEFLRQYRKVAHSETGEAPAKLFLGRNIRTRLDLVRPLDTQSRITEKQRAGFNSMFRILNPGENVYFISGNTRMDKWIPGIILQRIGDLHYRISYNGTSIKRHIDQIKRFHVNDNNIGTTTTPTEMASAPPTAPTQQNKSSYMQDEGTSRKLHFYEDAMTSSRQQSESESSDEIDVPPESPVARYLTPCASPQHVLSDPLAIRRSDRLRRPPQKYSP